MGLQSPRAGLPGGVREGGRQHPALSGCFTLCVCVRPGVLGRHPVYLRQSQLPLVRDVFEWATYEAVHCCGNARGFRSASSFTPTPLHHDFLTVYLFIFLILTRGRGFLK